MTNVKFIWSRDVFKSSLFKSIRMFPDFYLPELNVVIESDGKYWHNYPTGRAYDIEKDRRYRLAGFEVIRVWDEKGDTDIIHRKLVKLMESM